MLRRGLFLSSDVPLGDFPSGLAEKSHGQRNQEENDEDSEEDLRNSGRCAGNAAKAENACNQRDDEKDEGIVEHGDFSLFRCRENAVHRSLFQLQDAPESGISLAEKCRLCRNLIGSSTLSGDTVTNPLDPMTEHSKKAPVANGLPGMAAFHPGVSAQLREYYQSVQEEGIPERFLQLLEQLDMAERQASEATRIKDNAR